MYMILCPEKLQQEQIVAVCDSREQRPLVLTIPTIRAALPYGDYSLRGMEHRIAIERKSISDLCGCVGRDRERFQKCIDGMEHYEYAELVIEGTPDQIALKQYIGEVHPNAVLGSVYKWTNRRIRLTWAGSAHAASSHVSRRLLMLAREYYVEARKTLKYLKNITVEEEK
jgi:ERCC4-type nuclease